MNRDTPIKIYCKKVGQHLDCGRKERTELLRGLCEEILVVALLAAAFGLLLKYTRSRVPEKFGETIYDTSPEPSDLESLDWEE